MNMKRFLVQVGLSLAMILAANVSSAFVISSGGTNFFFPDAGDRGCNGKGPCSKGMVTWSVSEPYLNLWLADAPVSYTTSLGEEISFQLFYKQRDTAPPRNNRHQKWYLYDGAIEGGVAGPPADPPPPPPAFVPPTGWNHNWFSYIRFAGVYHLADTNATDFRTNAWQDFSNWKATLYVAGGGAIDFASGVSFTANDNANNAHLTGCTLYPMNGNPQHIYPATNNGTAFVPNGGTNVYGQIGFRLVYADGSMDLFGQVTPLYGASAVADAVLTGHVDPYGNSTRFYYTNRLVGSVPSFFLTHMVDYDGQTNTLTYNTNNLLARVDLPYGRFATFEYNDSGKLVKLTDAVGLVSEIAYDSGTSEPNWLKTPYGETTFAITDDGELQNGMLVGDAGGSNRVSRAICITHPNDGKELFVYRFDASQVGLTATLPSHEIPASPLGTLDTGSVSNRLSGLHTRNTFHWSRRQYELLSTNEVTALTTNDYKLATRTHWLAANEKFLSDQPALIQEGSPDGGATPGAQTWFDYAGKPAEWLAGNGSQTAVCQVLPDGATRFRLTTVDGTGNPTAVTATYEAPGGGVTARSYHFQYENLTGTETGSDSNSVISLAVWNFTALASITGPESETLLSLSASADEIVTNTLVANGNMFTYVTTRPQRRELTVTDAVSRTANVWFNARQQVLGARLFNDVWLTNTYGADGWLTRTINLSAEATNTLAFANGLLSVRTNPVGLVSRYEWDNLERLSTVSFPDGSGYTNAYQKLHLQFQSDRLGNFTEFKHDPFGVLTNITDALLHHTTFSYCFCGALETVTDPAHASTTYGYDDNGRLLSESDSDGFVRNYRRNRLGQITNVTDTAGNARDFIYNHQGLVKQVSNPTGTLYEVVYDIRDRPATVTGAYGAVVMNTYDYLNRLTERSLLNGPLTHTETFEYSAQGLISRTDAEQRVTLFGYDPAGRLNAVTNANQEVVSATFNPLGRRLTLTDGRNQTTRWAYDEFGRTVAETNAQNVLVRTNGYDANGQRTTVWTPAKGLTSLSYDAVGNLKTLVSSNRSVTADYDALNRLTNTSDAGGTIARAYTNFGAFQGALKSEDGPWADDKITVYRSANRKLDHLDLIEPGGATPRSWTFGMDGLNRLKTLNGSAGNFTFDYAGPGRRLLATHLPGGNTISNVFDPAGQLLERWLKDSSGAALDAYRYTPDLTGLRTNVVRGDDTHVEYGFDGIGQLTNAVAYEADGTTLRKNEDFQYAYDAGGNLQTRVNHTLTQTFGVDDANQLTTATRSGTLTVAGTVNALAQSVTVNGQGTEIYGDKTFATTNGLTLSNGSNALTFAATDAASHTTSFTESYDLPATNNYAYDLNGNLTRDGARGYEYDDANRLTRITATNQWKSEFGYDALSRRNVRREYVWNGASWSLKDEVRYVWFGMTLMQERTGGNTVRVTYTGRLAREDANGASFYFSDGNRNVSSLIDSSGNLKAKYRYDSFGNLLSKSGSLADVNLIRFSGKEYHAQSGLYYYGYRLYAPNLQRWMNQDPIGIAGGLNLYGFVENDPINYFDPNGLTVWQDVKDTCQGVGDWLGEKARDLFYGKDYKPSDLGADPDSQLAQARKETPDLGLLRDGNGNLVKGGDVGMEVGVIAITGAAIPEIKALQALTATKKIRQLKGLEEAGEALQGERALQRLAGEENAAKAAAEAEKALKPCPVRSPKPNDGVAPPHGGEAHDAAIDAKIAEARDAKAENIRKNQTQTDVHGNRVGDNRPDAQWDLNGRHYNYEIDTTEAGSLLHQRVVPGNDPNAINSFERLP